MTTEEDKHRVDDEPNGKMSMTWENGALSHVTMAFPHGHHSMEVGLAGGLESIATRRGRQIETKASPVTAGDEDAELSAGEMLRRYLNTQAGTSTWLTVTKVTKEPEQGRDLALYSPTHEPLYVQVVSADVDRERWRFYRGIPNESFYGENGLTVERAARRILDAVALKEQRFAPSAKRDLVLLLDARGVPEASDSAVQAEIRANIGPSEFAAIYVAGLNNHLVWQVR